MTISFHAAYELAVTYTEPAVESRKEHSHIPFPGGEGNDDAGWELQDVLVCGERLCWFWVRSEDPKDWIRKPKAKP